MNTKRKKEILEEFDEELTDKQLIEEMKRRELIREFQCSFCFDPIVIET